MTRIPARRVSTLLLAILLLPILAACSDAETGTPTAVSLTPQAVGGNATPPATDSTNGDTTSNIARPASWDEASHGNNVDPNYAVVFPAGKVNQMTITIAPESWDAMQANMTALLGEEGQGEARGGPGGGFGGPPNGGGGPGGGRGMNIPNPDWFTATISFAGQTWTNVGVRYKGNSSLSGSWREGTGKMPFKLDFDQWENEYPAIDNQRFYGFKQISLSNNWNDSTYMRETITYDLLEEAGLVAASTAFYEILVDHGDGPQSLGIYTAIEVIDDTVIGRTFGDDSGNIYEGDGQGASFATGTQNQIESSFQKENNEEAADWSDVEALYEVLHSTERITDPAAWRSKLEAIFDVDGFLEWLAISAAIQHWDTYGGMAHNYYLYNDPTTGKLTWISWDHNLVLGAIGGRGGQNGGPGGNFQPGGNRQPGGNGGGRGGFSMSTTLDKSDVGDQWPLIRYLLDQPEYKARYVNYMSEFGNGIFDTATLTAKYNQLAAILQPYAPSPTDYQTALDTLITRTEERVKAVADFLATQ